ncbi:hypothetical protein BSKO_11297 [Bryopsis sp. KO-2023]|nr:hypothetical protein BSKO_11297 [Bryopsis sp. KO-2023]
MTIPSKNRGLHQPTRKISRPGLFAPKIYNGPRNQANASNSVAASGEESQASCDPASKQFESKLKQEIDRLRNEAVIKMGKYQEIKAALEDSEEARIKLKEENDELKEGKTTLEEALLKTQSELDNRKVDRSGEKCRAWLKQAEGRSTVIAAKDGQEEALPASNRSVASFNTGAQSVEQPCNGLSCVSSWNSYCDDKENEEVVDLQGDLPVGGSSGDQDDEPGSTLESVQKENHRLKKERGQLVADFEAKISAIERSCEYRVLEISDRKKEKEEELDGAIQEKETLSNLVNKLESEKLAALNELESAQKTLGRKEKEIEKLNFDHDQKVREWRIKVDEVVVQKCQVSKSTIEIEKQAKKSNEEAQQLSSDVIHQKKDIETLRSNMESLERANADLLMALKQEKESQKKMLGEKHRKVQSLESEVADLKAEIESIQDDCSRAKKTCRQAETETKSKVDELEKDAFKSKSEAIECAKNLMESEARINTLESENSMIACERDEIVGKLVDLQNELHAKHLECSNVLGRLKRKEAFETELRTLQEVMKNKEAEEGRAAEKVKRMERGLNDATRSRDLLKSKIKELEARAAEQEESRKVVESKMLKMKERGLHVAAELKGAEDKLKRTERMLEERVETCASKDLQLAEVKLTLNKTISTVEGLGSECNEVNTECQRLRSELNKSDAEVSRLSSDLEKRESDVVEIQKQALTLEKEVEGLSNGKTQTEAALRDAREQVVVRDEKVASLERLLCEKKAELGDCNQALHQQMECVQSAREEVGLKTETVSRLEKLQAESDALVKDLRRQIETLRREVTRESTIAKQFETSEAAHVAERRKMESELNELSKFVKLQEAELLGLRSRRVRGPGFVQELLCDKNEHKVLGTKLKGLGRKLSLKMDLPLYPTPVQIVQSLHKVVRHLDDQAPARALRIQDSASSHRGQSHPSTTDTDDSGSGECAKHTQPSTKVATKKREATLQGKGKKGAHLSSRGKDITYGIQPLRHPQKLVLLR